MQQELLKLGVDMALIDKSAGEILQAYAMEKE